MTEEKSPQPATPPALLTVDEVALLLRVAPKTVYRYLSQGQLPSVRFGGAVRVSRDDLLSFFASKGAQGGISAPERAGVAAAPLAKAACASCRRLLPQELLSATCLSPGCGGLLCNDCQAQWPSLLCPKHRPSLEQRLELARGQGRKVVLAGDAALWEQDFLNRFVTGVEALTQFPHPLGGASSARNAARRSEEPLGAQELPLAPEGPFPRGLATVYTFPAGRDGRRNASRPARGRGVAVEREDLDRREGGGRGLHAGEGGEHVLLHPGGRADEQARGAQALHRDALGFPRALRGRRADLLHHLVQAQGEAVHGAARLALLLSLALLDREEGVGLVVHRVGRHDERTGLADELRARLRQAADVVEARLERLGPLVPGAGGAPGRRERER